MNELKSVRNIKVIYLYFKHLQTILLKQIFDPFPYQKVENDVNLIKAYFIVITEKTLWE